MEGSPANDTDSVPATAMSSAAQANTRASAWWRRTESAITRA
jgi:hypothetical protein